MVSLLYRSRVYGTSIGHTQMFDFTLLFESCRGTKTVLIFILLLLMEIRAQRDQSASASKGGRRRQHG